MIGDWVFMRLHGKDKYYEERVCGISDAEFLDHIPIPLTEEMLKANGFEYYSDEYIYWLDEDGLEPPFRIFRNSKGVLRISVGYKLVVLRYVHELQHALRLCGLNELADNFKTK